MEDLKDAKPKLLIVWLDDSNDLRAAFLPAPRMCW